MTIAYDSVASTTRTAAGSASTFTLSPVGTPKGVAVAITQKPTSTDFIASVTYGGVAMSRVVRATDAASERGSSDLWYLGSGVPTGDKPCVVSYNSSAQTNHFHLTAISLTAAGDTEVVDFDSINGDTTDPSLPLQYSGRTCIAIAAHYGGAADPSAFVPNSNCTTVSEYDFSAQFSKVIRQTTVGTADFTIGGTCALEDAAFAAMALGEVATAVSVDTIIHVSSSSFTVTSSTTGGYLQIPLSTLSGDDLMVFITSRGHNGSTDYPTCTDNDATGNPFSVVDATPSRKGTIYWKKATNDSAGKTVTILGAVNSCAAGISAYRGGDPTGMPITNITKSSTNTQNPSVTGFTPDTPSSLIGLVVFNYTNNVAVTSPACSSPGALTTRFECQSTGGDDCAVIHASALQSSGLAGTGNFTWTQANNDNYSIAFALKPSSTTTTTSSSTTAPTTPSVVTDNSATTQHPVHKYASTGTYLVTLTVTDNDGNTSSATSYIFAG